MSSALVIRNLSFIYDAAPSPLFHDLDLHFPPGWTGVVGPNGSGKTTLLLLAAGQLTPTSGEIHAPGDARSCPQRTDEAPQGLGVLLESTDADAVRLRARLGLHPDWLERWGTLSHGERKRAQIACALAASPALLVVDEPTNHLDREARRTLAQALGAYRGVGLLVSHDRELLDELCGQCLFLAAGRATMRAGGYTAGRAETEREREARRRAYQESRDKAQRLQREAARRRAEASRADRRRSKRDLRIHDSDGKEKIDRARVSGKDGQSGRLARQMEGRVQQAEAKAREAFTPAERELKFWLAGSVYRGDAVVRLEAGALELGGGTTLRYPELRLGGTQRVGLCGANGSGKSSLVRRIVGSLTLPPSRVVYLPQEIPEQESRELAVRLRSLPESSRGHLMTVVAGLGSDPRGLLRSELPSPGETRKLLLGLGVVGEPWLIVMDEPTNHLDLPSIELLERSLAECPCALLLVSHDSRFLDAVGCARWRIEPEEPRGFRLRL